MFGIFKSNEEKLLDAAIGSLRAAPSIGNRLEPSHLKLAVSVANDAIKDAERRSSNGEDVDRIISSIRSNAELHKKTEIGVGFKMAEAYVFVAQYRHFPKHADRTREACRDFGKFVHLVLGLEWPPKA